MCDLTLIIYLTLHPKVVLKIKESLEFFALFDRILLISLKSSGHTWGVNWGYCTSAPCLRPKAVDLLNLQQSIQSSHFWLPHLLIKESNVFNFH